MHKLNRAPHFHLTKSPTPCEQPKVCGFRIYSFLRCSATFIGNFNRRFGGSYCLRFQGKLQSTGRHIPHVCNLQLTWQILAVLPMPHCQTFHARRPIMLNTDARLGCLAFRRHSQTLCSFQNIQDTHVALVLKLTRASCLRNDSSSSVLQYWFPCNKRDTRWR